MFDAKINKILKPAFDVLAKKMSQFNISANAVVETSNVDCSNLGNTERNKVPTTAASPVPIDEMRESSVEEDIKGVCVNRKTIVSLLKKSLREADWFIRWPMREISEKTLVKFLRVI